MTTRRDFLKTGTALTAGTWALLKGMPAYGQESAVLRKFVEPLRAVGASDGIPIMRPDTERQAWWQPDVDHYTIDIAPFEDRLHPSLPNPTRLWGYGQDVHRHLGGVIVARRGTPVQVTFRNQLPAAHLLPVDTTIPGAAAATNRTSAHLHGGFTPWVSDGGPHAWWDPDGHRGPSFVDLLHPGMAPNESEHYYPNDQSARMLWYHDHAVGITRLNVYAGLASAYVLTDDYEDELVDLRGLPGPLDARTVYLVFQDKTFVSSLTAAADPAWQALVPDSRPGDLWYAHEGESETGAELPDPSEVPEFFGDTMLVNGTAYPYLEVEQREYRLRMLNACNARFLNPRLVHAQGSAFPDNTEPSLHRPGPEFVQIGNEGGFLPHPTLVGGRGRAPLVLGPAERADLLVDFRYVPVGSTFLLYSDAPAPFPSGDASNDHHPGNSQTPSSVPGYGPNTRTLLQIRVKRRSGRIDRPILLPHRFAPTDPFLVPQRAHAPTHVPTGVPLRRLTLNETIDSRGRLIQFLGTDVPIDPGADDLLFGRSYDEPATEVIPRGTVEAWEIVNLTGDAHPIHFHLVNVQLLSRQAFDADGYTGGPPRFTGPVRAPDPNELGWKETVRMNPGEVTRVMMTFDLPDVPFAVPASARTGGHEYVWHCHILEHEEHDMMRPLVVA